MPCLCRDDVKTKDRPPRSARHRDRRGKFERGVYRQRHKGQCAQTDKRRPRRDDQKGGKEQNCRQRITRSRRRAPVATALIGLNTGFGAPDQIAVANGYKRCGDLVARRNGHQGFVKAARQPRQKRAEPLRVGGHDNRAHADALPGNKPLAQAVLDPDHVDQPGVRGLSGQVGNIAIELHRQRPVKRLFANEPIGQKNFADQNVLTPAHRNRAQQIAARHLADIGQNFADRRRRPASRLCGHKDRILGNIDRKLRRIGSGVHRQWVLASHHA